MFKLKSYINQISANVYYISYNSPNYAGTLQNETNSTIKTKIDSWYETNIVSKKDVNGKAITDYISDEVFCNDRSIHSGSGYLLSSTTHYGASNRILNQYKPSLSCSQTSDKFSVANGKLTYPVALITIDEASLIGGKVDNINDQYYLNIGSRYWTMTPYNYNHYSVVARLFVIDYNGDIEASNVYNQHYVRPVINIKSNVKITKGTGTASNPYELTIE